MSDDTFGGDDYVVLGQGVPGDNYCEAQVPVRNYGGNDYDIWGDKFLETAMGEVTVSSDSNEPRYT